MPSNGRRARPGVAANYEPSPAHRGLDDAGSGVRLFFGLLVALLLVAALWLTVIAVIIDVVAAVVVAALIALVVLKVSRRPRTR